MQTYHTLIHKLIFPLLPLIFLFQGCCKCIKPTPTTTPKPATEYTKSIPQTITIASFNIRIYSNSSRDDEELGYIADILQKYDLIAIQELRDEEVLQRTVDILKARGTECGYEISEPVGKGVKERYAFLYRKDKVNTVCMGKLYQEQNDEFIREPFYATFKAGNFDFTLITIHVLYGSSKTARRLEIRELTTVYNRVQNEDPTEQDIIILGDFNFTPDDEGFDNLKTIPTMTFLIEPPNKTTITDTSLYDNFWFQNEYLSEYNQNSGIDMFDEIMFNNDDTKAKLTVSDHRPIWAEFDITQPDDD